MTAAHQSWHSSTWFTLWLRLSRTAALLCACVGSVSAAWTLNTGPFSASNLGSPVSTTLQENNVMFQDGAGHKHWISLYDTDLIWVNDYEIVDIDVTTGTAVKVAGDKGRANMYNTCIANGKVYIASSDPSHLVEYDPATQTVRKLGGLAQISARILQRGDDGNVYIGECCDGGVERFNIGTDTLENLGRFDPSGGALQYAYTLGADTRYVYVGFGQSPWYLAIHDTVGATTNLYYKADGDLSGSVYQGATGGWFYYRDLAGGGSQWYALTNGVPVATNAPSVIAYYNQRGLGTNTVAQDTSNFTNLFSIEADLVDSYPDNFNNSATYKWRTYPGGGAWSTASVSTFTLQPATIKRVISYSSQELFCAADYYGPCFRWSTVTNGVSSQLGRPQISLYDLLKSGSTIWLSGYPANTLTYASGSGWTLNGSTDINSPAINPHSLGAGFGKYHYYSALGSDGNVYIGAHHERDSTGGELGWYPVTSGTRGSERTAFLNDDVADLLSFSSGAKLAYSSLSSNLFIFNVATRTITGTFQPLTNSSPGKVIETDSGNLLGASGTRLYLMNPTTGALVASASAGGTCFGGVASNNRRLVKGPDGYAWLYIGNVLSRVHPTTLAVTPITTNTAQNLMFQGGDIYLYGTTELSKVSSVLQAYTPPVTKTRGFFRKR